MDDRRFDALARSLASGMSRRHVLRGLLGGSAALVATRAGTSLAADKVTVCHWNGTSYDQISVSTNAVPAHTAHRHDIVNPNFTSNTTCGNCNTACLSPQTCGGGGVPGVCGGCVPSCQPGLCGDDGCGVSCTCDGLPNVTGATCQSNGQCRVTACSAPFADCNASAADGCETNLGTNVEHCGHCGNACPPVDNGTATCTDGECGFVCNAGFSDCLGACLDLSSNPNNCGTCGTPCADGQQCVDGACQTQGCAPGQYPAGDDCGLCEPGFYSSSGTECTPCAAGTFADAPGATGCQACPPNTYAPNQAQATCSFCSCVGACDAISGDCLGGQVPVSGACEVDDDCQSGVCGCDAPPGFAFCICREAECLAEGADCTGSAGAVACCTGDCSGPFGATTCIPNICPNGCPEGVNCANGVACVPFP